MKYTLSPWECLALSEGLKRLENEKFGNYSLAGKHIRELIIRLDNSEQIVLSDGLVDRKGN